jgi:hypothetical protein
MLEKMKSVSNPLTIIALFAALAELAGTAVLVCLFSIHGSASRANTANFGPPELH